MSQKYCVKKINENKKIIIYFIYDVILLLKNVNLDVKRKQCQFYVFGKSGYYVVFFYDIGFFSFIILEYKLCGMVFLSNGV